MYKKQCILLFFLLTGCIVSAHNNIQPNELNLLVQVMNPDSAIRRQYLPISSLEGNRQNFPELNPEISAIALDSLHRKAYRVARKAGEYDIWAKDLSDGSKAIALINLSDTARMIKVRVEVLRMSGTLRDIREHKDIKDLTWDGGLNVQPHEIALCKLTPFSRYITDSQVKDINRKWSPEEVCRLFANNLIARHNSEELHYAEVCTAIGAFRAADLLQDKNMLTKLLDRYADFYSANSIYHNYRAHVDVRMRGSLPLEIYLLTKDKRYLDYGLSYANLQWAKTIEDGLSSETRWWIDDMYMITILQVQAYRASGDRKYVSRAAQTLIEYCKRLQRPNGMFYHGPKFPHIWGRGNGWSAVGMAEVLKTLPKSDKLYPELLHFYIKMMDALVENQDMNGMWHQLVDKQDSWPETSCTAMFGYALAVGVNKGILSNEKYKIAVQNAWRGLSRYINPDGTVREVCVGTGQNTDEAYYLNRARIVGDYHGQAPVLWFAAELCNPKNRKNIK